MMFRSLARLALAAGVVWHGWTRSLNTDSWHFIRDSGTAYPLLALAACGELPAKQ